MLFALETGQVIAGGVIGALSVFIPVVVNEYLRLARARRDGLKQTAETRRQERADALLEYKEFVERMERREAAHYDRMQKQDDKIFLLQESDRAWLARYGEAVEKIARQEGVINGLTADVRRLQAITHDAYPGVTLPLIITATLEGIVMDVNAASGPLLHWLPTELKGKNVDVLVPERLKAAHTAALAKVREGVTVVDPAKGLRTTARKRDGQEIDVVIHLSSWKSPLGNTFVTAEIRTAPSPGDLAVREVNAVAAPASKEPV